MDPLAALRVDEEIEGRSARLAVRLNEYGYDPWGFHLGTFQRAMVLGRWFYRRYFRCDTVGAEKVPRGRVMLVANHSGQLPCDAAMLAMALFLECEPPRAVTGMVERLAARTPFVSEYFVRLGQMTGTPENCRQMFEEGRAVMVFPEGVRGLGKVWRDRYRLERFGGGFLRLCLECRTPIVPVGLAGFEESMPSFSQLRPLARLLGLPYLPLTPTLLPVPLPTRCYITFGDPIRFRGSPRDDDALIGKKVRRVAAEIDRLIQAGLSRRTSIF
ncbi:MAG: acyltransferase family protein [Planctomycetes bacterium]|nr:acyltransferase family protein [Planctomycetota bacterium]